MEALAYLFFLMPYVVAALLGLGLSLLSVMCYSRFGAGIAVICIAFALDAITQSTPLLNLGITLYVADLPMIFIAVVAGVRWVMREDVPRRHMAWVAFVLIFFADLAIGLALHGTAAGVQARNDFYSVAAASYVMSFPIGRQQLRQTLAALAWLAGLLLLLCVYRWTVYYGNISALMPAAGTYNIDGAIRVIGSSAALVLAQAMILGLFFGGLSPTTKILRAGVALLIGAVLALQHRSVWLAGLVGIAVSMLLARAQRVSRLQQVGMLAFFVMVTGLGLTFSGKLTDDIRSSATRAIQGQGTVAARFENWRVTIADWRAAGPRAIAIGREFGSDTTRVVANADGGNVRIKFGAHNNYVSMLTSTGVIGLAAYIWVVASTMRRLLKNCRSRLEDAGFDAALLVLLVSQLVYYVAYSTDFVQFMILGVALAAGHRRLAAQAVPAPLANAGRMPPTQGKLLATK